MIYIYAVRTVPPGTHHGHIAAVKWKDPDSGDNGESTRETMVDWLSDPSNSAYVCGDSAHIARVGVVQADPPHIRTHADGDWKDNLLSLPRY